MFGYAPIIEHFFVFGNTGYFDFLYRNGILENMKKQMRQTIFEATKKLGWEILLEDILVEYPPEEAMGEYTTNVAFLLSKKLKRSPLDIAKELAASCESSMCERIEAVAPGYVNFFLTQKMLQAEVGTILEEGRDYGKNTLFSGKKIMLEYTDPNPFKVFHIGHLMPNVIGESLSRLYAWSGAEVKCAVFYGDVGMHVAKALWGAQKTKEHLPQEGDPLRAFTKFFGAAYVIGSNAYEADESAKQEMREMNKKIYEHSDASINVLYDLGREKSLEHFEEIYARLGTKFDFYFPESKTGPRGKKIVEENMDNGIFERSDGATVFHGEKYGLHTRVFLNKEGLPTYEAKDLGLAFEKRDVYPYDLALTVTGNEIQEYFKVIICALGKIDSELAKKIVCVAHGMLRFIGGKMSSRTGKVITGESLMDDMRAKASAQFTTDMSDTEKEKISDQIGIGAIKYSILKQSLGRNIIFDPEQSLSLEGNSGAYLQYTLVRARSVLRKAETLGIHASALGDFEKTSLEYLLSRFGERVEYACAENAPHFLCEYLFALAQAFNHLYAKNPIAEAGGTQSAYRIAVTQAVVQVLESGLTLLGMPIPERM